jgi:hypothetical protein
MSEPDITHFGAENVNIGGAVIGRSSGDAVPAPGLGASGPFPRNEGVLNLGLSRINVSGAVTRPGAIVHVGGPEPGAEVEL